MIQHVTRTIRPTQLSDCLAFYSLLGLRPAQVPAGIAGRAEWLQWPEHGAASQLHLMLDDDAVPDAGHFAIVCPDYEETVQRLRRAGHKVDPRREHWAASRSYVRDPAGSLVELMERAPGEPQSAPGRQE
jgi:catechol 2,3-dioxygenase-like lactoylglutathione lyase family enzyme